MDNDERFRLAFYHSGIGAFLYSLDGCFLDVNPKFCQILGYSQAELEGKLVSDFTETAERLIPFGEDAFEAIRSFMPKNKKLIICEVSTSLVRDHDGAPLYYTSHIKDISKQKKIEQELLQLSIAVEQCPLTIAITDIAGRIEYVNPAFFKISGYKADEALGRNPRMLQSGRTSRDTYKELWRKVTSGEVWSGVFINKRKNGEIYYEEAIISPVKNETGRVIKYIAVKNDITIRKNQEEYIRLSNERLQNLLAISQMKDVELQVIFDKALEVALDLTSSSSGFIYYLEGAEKRVVFRSSRLATEPSIATKTLDNCGFIHSFFWTEAQKKRKVVIDNNFDPAPYLHEMPAHHLKIVRFLAVPVFSSGEIIALAVMANKNEIYEEMDAMQLGLLAESVCAISIQKQNDIKLQKYAHELEEINATKDKFFNIIAHDLKNPFNALLGFSEILYSNADKYTNQQIVEFASMMYQSTKQTYLLLENLLNWSRVQTGKLKPNKIEVIPGILIADICELTNPLAQAKQIEIVAHCSIESLLFLDREMTKTVLRNLLVNAIKFSYPESIVRLDAHQTENEAVFSVSDQGMGINRKHIDDLFKINSRFSQVGTANETGTGLGLVLCKEFVEMQGGRIWIESEAGKGSTFYFSLPIADGLDW